MRHHLSAILFLVAANLATGSEYNNTFRIKVEMFNILENNSKNSRRPTTISKVAAEQYIKSPNKESLVWATIEGIDIAYSPSENGEKIRERLEINYQEYLHARRTDYKGDMLLSASVSDGSPHNLAIFFSGMCGVEMTTDNEIESGIYFSAAKETSENMICKMMIYSLSLNDDICLAGSNDKGVLYLTMNKADCPSNPTHKNI